MSRICSMVVAVMALALPASAAAQPPTITGTHGADRLRGTPGADRIDGRRGADRIDGRRGSDVIRCGAGRDYVIAERRDTVGRDCETVTYRRSLDDEIVDSPVEH